MKLTTKLLTSAALATGLATGAAFADGHDPFQVGFIYVGPTGDLGWTYEHDQGRLAVEEAYGDQVETVFLESVPEGADAERAITTMILGGADMVFTTSFGYMEATNAVAAQAAAQEAGIYSFGQASDMFQFAPAPRIASIIDNWAPYYVERVGAAIEGTWEQSDRWDGIAEGMVEIGEMTDAIPEEVRASAQEMIDAMAAGEYHPFTGPINRQDGTAWLADGEVADDGTLAGMDFYVEGITGDIPN